MVKLSLRLWLAAPHHQHKCLRLVRGAAPAFHLEKGESGLIALPLRNEWPGYFPDTTVNLRAALGWEHIVPSNGVVLNAALRRVTKVFQTKMTSEISDNYLIITLD